MNVSTTTDINVQGGEAADDQVRDSVANAGRDASKTVEHAMAVNDAVADTGIVGAVSRISYTGAYALSFGIVYAAVFATQWIPQDNPVMVGLSDGARAAQDALRNT
jgi:hypothetical protein